MKYLVLGALPSLKNLNTWFTTEVQLGIGFVALIICIVLGIKQKWGIMVGVVFFFAFLFFMANDPSTIFDGIGEIFKKIFGG